MKAVIAIDSFKGSMTSMEAGEAAKRGILRAMDAEIVVKPLADGGEGTTEALVTGLGGSFRSVEVKGPLGKPTQARYGILPDGKTAVLEMAEASGIILVPRTELNPWRASTVGVGQMILDAIRSGCRDFLIGIGGSATTEVGIGMLSALGWDFYDRDGALLPPVFDSLEKVVRIEAARVPKELQNCHFRIACDVTNPLCGACGAVSVFGPQKGVKPEEIPVMDAAMARYAATAEAFSGKRCAEVPGAGAAGGLGFAFLNFFPHVELRSGIDIVLEAVDLETALRDADVVLTGEGRLDGQTAMGKVPVGVARLAKKHGCKVLAFAGGVTEDATACNAAGIDAFFPIVRGITTLEEAMKPEIAKHNMELAVEQVFRLLRA